MKKLFVLSLLVAFISNQVYAFENNNNKNLVSNIVKARLGYVAQNMSKEDVTKLKDEVNSNLEKLDNALNTISDKEFEEAKNLKIAELKNTKEDDMANGILSSLKDNEKSLILNSIDEEELLLANSENEAISNKLKSEIKLQNLKNIEILHSMNKSHLKEKVKKMKEEAKQVDEKLHNVYIWLALSCLIVSMALFIGGIWAPTYVAFSAFVGLYGTGMGACLMFAMLGIFA